jgi:hypothetical protein
MNTATLWTLPWQPLPLSTLPDNIFVTVWLFVCFIAAGTLYFLLKRPQPAWPEFVTILRGTLLLATFV